LGGLGRPLAEAGEVGLEPRNDPAATEGEDEDQQDRRDGGVEALQRQL
jgi:hypothetical protein